MACALASLGGKEDTDRLAGWLVGGCRDARNQTIKTESGNRRSFATPSHKPNQKEKLLQYIIEIFPRIQRLAKVLSKENNEIRNGRWKNHNNSPLKRLKLLL